MRDLLTDLKNVPKNATIRKVNELVKRVRLAKAHAHIVGHLKKEMPSMFGNKGKAQAKLGRQNAALHKELAQRTQRHAQLARTQQRLGVERALQGKGRRKKVKPREGQPRQYKWRQERKR
mgnify:CR=1 FL=1